jgi:hypothetical protein
LSVIGAALAFVLLAPAAVLGEEQQPATAWEFRLPASNGFKLVAVAYEPHYESKPSAAPSVEEGEIFLFLIHSRSAFVTYGGPARVTPTTIDADLGKLGKISVTRVATGGTTELPLKCGSRKTKRVSTERYEGTIEFHGEEGFTDVSATVAPFVHPTPCSLPGGGSAHPGKRPLGASLHVSKEPNVRYGISLNAVQMRPGAKTEISAEVEEQRGRLEIDRIILARGSPAALQYDRRLLHATLKPPAPFSGSGRFRARNVGLNRRAPGIWTGNLTADFPGRRDVALTGPGFWSSLEHPRR